VAEPVDLDKEARVLVSAYYAYHSEDGDESPCPCDVCERARRYFNAVLTTSTERRAE
jgi:hypothetical protein